jgi:hypothetical protein
MNHIEGNLHQYIGPTNNAARRKQHWTTTQKKKLIEEWEKNTGRTWPRYDAAVPAKTPGAAPYRKVGDLYDMHEIIPSSYNGPLEWWNIQPAASRVQHQDGIQAVGLTYRELFPHAI